MTKITMVDMVELPKIVEMAPKTTDYVKIGRALANQIKENGLGVTKEVREQVCSDLNCSLNHYYAVLNILKEASFAKKEGSQYLLDNEFVSGILNEWLEWRL